MGDKNEGMTYNPKIKLNSSNRPDRIRSPCNIVVPICNLIHQISPHNTRETDHKSDAEEERNYDALAEREVEAQNDGDWDQHDAEVV
jgi:hypothetical protein